MTQQDKSESFKTFKDSFAYGSRTDLNFKFLSILSEVEAADFIQDLFSELSRSFDSGHFDQVYELVRGVQKKAYEKSTRWIYDDRPLTELKKPLSEAKIMLLTSSGHFLEGNDPQPFGIKNMSQEQAIHLIDDFLRTEPTLSEIPIDTPPEYLKVRHGGYHIEAAIQDHNVNFPMQALHQLKDEGFIGSLNPTAFSFVGACAQTPLKKNIIPNWIERFKQDDIDAALLVPV